MDKEWQLQEAKANLSQLIRRAAGGCAQVVTVHGKPAAVVVSAEEYARLTRRWGKLSAALLRPELAAEDLDISRSRDTGRRSAPSRLRKLRSRSTSPGGIRTRSSGSRRSG